MSDLIPAEMIRAAARELDDHRGMSYDDHWWCECGAGDVVASQEDSDAGISSHMARAVIGAALSAVTRDQLIAAVDPTQRG